MDLICAINRNNIQRVKELLQAGANPNIREINSWTPLMWASWYGYTECLRLLLRAGANTNLRDKYGCTAIKYNSKKILKILKRMHIVQIINDYF
jgi:ankyrin repeat protein